MSAAARSSAARCRAAAASSASRKAARLARANERLVAAAKGGAAAYCLRTLTGRSREAMRHALSRWLVCACEADAVDRLYASEERGRQQLLLQAQAFQSRLEALEDSAE